MIDKGRANLPRVQIVHDFDVVQLYKYGSGGALEACTADNTDGLTPGLFKQALTAGVAGYFVINPYGKKMGSMTGIKTKTAAGLAGLTKVNVVLEEYWGSTEGWCENPTYEYELTPAQAVKGLTFYPWVEGVILPCRLKVTLTGASGDQLCAVVMG